MTSTDLKQTIQMHAAKRSMLQVSTRDREQKILDGVESVEAIEEAQALVQLVATETQNQLKFHLEDLVQHALDSLLPGKYTFKLEFEIQRGKTAASMFLESAYGDPMDPMDECGGTVTQITAFALRVAAWTLAGTDNTILLDEPFAAVSADFRPICGELLSGLASRLGIQFIVIASHESGTASYLLEYADRIFEVSQDKDGRSSAVSRNGGRG